MAGRTKVRGTVLFAAFVLAVIAAAGGGTAHAAPGAETAELSVDVSAQRFVARGDRVVARGPVVATVTRSDGTTERLEQRVKLKVAPTKNCRILELDLAKLYLNLLGLEVRTSDIHVRITGQSKQTLGKLFCSLSEGLKLDKGVLAQRSAESLNRALRKQPLPVLSLEAPIRVQESTESSSARAPGKPGGGKGGNGGGGGSDVPPVSPDSCEVLDILLGPLHLNLLGLVVDLYGPTNNDPIRVLVTSDPNGGALGSTFCELAGPYEPNRVR